jgi:hypothetical protein
VTSRAVCRGAGGGEGISYRKIVTLRHHFVVAQDRREVLVHSRARELWRERFYTEGTIELDDPPLCIELAALYPATELAA